MNNNRAEEIEFERKEILCVFDCSLLVGLSANFLEKNKVKSIWNLKHMR